MHACRGRTHTSASTTMTITKDPRCQGWQYFTLTVAVFVSKYISKGSNFCGKTDDGGIVQVKLEPELGGAGGVVYKGQMLLELLIAHVGQP